MDDSCPHTEFLALSTLCVSEIEVSLTGGWIMSVQPHLG